MNQDISNQDIQTSDFYFALYLRTSGCELSGVSGTRERLVFHFDAVPKKLEQQYEFGSPQKDLILASIASFKVLKRILRKRDVINNNK